MLAPSPAIINAVARPMFRPEPVISATLPSSLPIFMHLFFEIRRKSGGFVNAL